MLRIHVFLAGMVGLLACQAEAIPLSVVNVSAPAIYCIFNPDPRGCTVMITETTGNINLPSGAVGVLRSYTYPDVFHNLYVYEYRLDLTQAAKINTGDCIFSLSVNFGPVVGTLDYDGDKAADDGFVITNGGDGTIGPTLVDQVGPGVTFTFQTPVCPGDSSYSLGLVSTTAPDMVLKPAEVSTSAVPGILVQSRVPLP